MSYPYPAPAVFVTGQLDNPHPGLSFELSSVEHCSPNDERRWIECVGRVYRHTWQFPLGAHFRYRPSPAFDHFFNSCFVCRPSSRRSA